eukprot:scaffold5549_cov109-Skeletonema_menzelii.AAC.3
MSSSTMNANNNHVAVSTTQKYLPQLPPQHASPPKLIKLSAAQLFVLSELRPQIAMKAVEHDPLVAASALRSKQKILFIASTESTERYTATSSITTRSKTKSKKKAVIKKEKDYLVALSALRSEKMLRDRRNLSKLMLRKKRDARNNCLVASSETSPTEHSPVYRNTRSKKATKKKNVTSTTSPPSNVIINDMPPINSKCTTCGFIVTEEIYLRAIKLSHAVYDSSRCIQCAERDMQLHRSFQRNRHLQSLYHRQQQSRRSCITPNETMSINLEVFLSQLKTCAPLIISLYERTEWKVNVIDMENNTLTDKEYNDEVSAINCAPWDVDDVESPHPNMRKLYINDDNVIKLCNFGYPKLFMNRLTKDEKRTYSQNNPFYQSILVKEALAYIASVACLVTLGIIQNDKYFPQLNAILKECDDESIEDALIRWMTSTGEMRNHQQLPCHTDSNKSNKEHPVELYSIHKRVDSQQGHGFLYFPLQNFCLRVMADKNVVVCNLSHSPHAPDKSRNTDNWSRVHGPHP